MHSQLVPGQSAVESTRPDTKKLRELREQRKALIKTGATTAARKASPASQQAVSVTLTNVSFSSRILNATVRIAAPVEVVWAALTDYDNLASFIPSLVENKCLERRPQGCLLHQVGSQDIALGVKFSAACTLEIQEYLQGMPDGLCTNAGNWDEYFPQPGGSSSASGGSPSASGNDGSSASSSCDGDGAAASGVRDISFSLVEGDFQAFKGVWRMAPGDLEGSTVLHYALYVKPHAWLPVGLIQGRISSEVVGNLKAVSRHAERLHRQQLKQQQVSGLNGGGSSSVGTDAEEAADQAGA